MMFSSYFRLFAGSQSLGGQPIVDPGRSCEAVFRSRGPKPGVKPARGSKNIVNLRFPISPRGGEPEIQVEGVEEHDV